MKVILVLIAFLAALTVPAVSQAAQPKSGGYMSGFIGISLPKDTTVTTDDFDFNDSYTDRAVFDPGINLGMTLGYDFGYLRLESELSYKQGAIRAVTDQLDYYRYRNVDGDLGVLALMFNGFFDLQNNSPLTPYCGGGIGFATLYLGNTYGTNTRGGLTTRDRLYRDGDDSVFAYQLGAGLELALNPTLSLDLGYRFFGTSKGIFDDHWDQSSDLRLKSHNVAAGFRIKF